MPSMPSNAVHIRPNFEAAGYWPGTEGMVVIGIGITITITITTHTDLNTGHLNLA